MLLVLSINMGSQVKEGRWVEQVLRPAAAAGGTNNTGTLGCRSACTSFQGHHHKCYLLFSGCRDEAGEGEKSALRNK